MKQELIIKNINKTAERRKQTPELVRCLKPNEFDKDHTSLIFDFECEERRQDDTVCQQCLQSRKSRELPPLRETLYPHKARTKPILSEATIAADQEYIKRLYSFLGKLDEAFWEDPKFMMWQLLRLNKNYRDEINALDDVYWNYLNETNTYEWVEPIFSRLGRDYFPEPRETCNEWKKRSEGEAWSLQYDLLQLQKEFEHVSFLDVDGTLNLMTMNNSNGQQLLLSPLSLYAAGYLPIDYWVRFPLPSFLDRLPEFRDVKKEKTGGRPIENWPLKLLIYELSQNGSTDKIIGQILLSERMIKKHVYPDKNSTYNKIKDTKTRIEHLAQQAYEVFKQSEVSHTVTH